MRRSAADRASDAAEALLQWLETQPKATAEAPRQDPPPSSAQDPLPFEHSPPPSEPTASSVEAGPPIGDGDWPLRPMHVDWLHHRLTVEGSAADVADFREQASGAGTIPWRLDLDSLEEDWFHRLVSPPPPHQRSLSLDGARILAGQLREAAGRRQALAVSRVGQSRTCPFDLHALLPVPNAVLRLGPDHPHALAWLWQHWSTTQELRHVRVEGGSAATGALPNEQLRISFWSADWTPWRALESVSNRWPGLRVDIRPSYEAA